MGLSTTRIPAIFSSTWELIKTIALEAGRLEWTDERLHLASKRKISVQLFLTSFFILFFELACIRWVPAHVRYLSYFMNFILLATFLGMGVGILLARRPRLWLPPFPVLWFGLAYLVAQNNFEFKIPSTQVLYYGATEGMIRAENFLILPLIFITVAATILPAGRSLGKLLTALPPLQAYAVDILGSLAGIAVFFLMSYYSLQPVVWFALIVVLYLSIRGGRELILTLPFLLGSVYLAYHLNLNSQWSPYYRIQTYPNQSGGSIISVNNAGHQEMAPLEEKENFYFRLYDLFPGRRFEHALILGAGTGSDVSIALHEGVGRVDAVEIDPLIYELGRRLHPDRPYDDSRVRVTIDDGRAFLRGSPDTYDLIVFALPDSLTLTSGFSSLRLESFLLTLEALQDARDHLSVDGLLVLYNYYREDWLIEKLAWMLQDVFNEAPYVTTYGDWGRAAVLIGARNLASLNPALDTPYSPLAVQPADQRGYLLPVLGSGRMEVTEPHTPAVDDWPFVYLPQRAFPRVFINAFAVVLLASAGLMFLARPGGGGRMRFNWHFFYLGLAFMLLETRSLVTFSLLFGTTWMVNSLVFFAILSSVLLAIFFNARFKIRNPMPLYALLAASILTSYLIPHSRLLDIENAFLRYTLASAMAFVPVFLANVVFSHSFRDTRSADIAFGSNLIGAMVGGMLEYTALALGYQALLLVALGAYLLAFAASWRRSPARSLVAVQAETD